MDSLDAMMRDMVPKLSLGRDAYPPPLAYPTPFQLQYAYPSHGDDDARVPPPENEDEEE